MRYMALMLLVLLAGCSGPRDAAPACPIVVVPSTAGSADGSNVVIVVTNEATSAILVTSVHWSTGGQIGDEHPWDPPIIVQPMASARWSESSRGAAGPATVKVTWGWADPHAGCPTT